MRIGDGRNTGLWLQELVRRIEEHVAPAGFTVSEGEKEFSANGIWIPEFDFIIHGPA